MKGDDSEGKKTAAYVFIAALLFYLAIILLTWDSQFYWDESVYSLMTEEFEDNPAMVIPTVIGENPELKPPLFTWISYLFHLFLQYLPLPAEVIMRIPSAFFGAGSGVFVFLLADRMYGRLVGIFSAAIFITAGMICFVSAFAMMEALSLFFIVGSMYFYASGRTGAGMAFLGMLALVKWLYAGLPMLFIIAYFWGEREKLLKITLSFLVVPAALLFYLALAAVFGDFDHAMSSLIWDLFRVSGSTLAGRIQNIENSFYALFPLSAILIVSLPFLSKGGKETRALIITGLLFIPIASAGQFSIWYTSPAVPSMAILAGLLLSRIGKREEAVLAAAVFVAVAFGASMYIVHSTCWPEDTGIKEVALFTQGKNVEFVEPGELLSVWKSGNDNYLGTDAERLLLEQRNTGFLYYRFWNMTDYGNVTARFINGSYSPGCVDYLVVHEKQNGRVNNANVTIPECMDFLFRKGNYAVYGRNG